MLPLEKLTQLRRQLHAQPELPGLEAHTAQTIQSYLQALKPDALLTGLGGHGLVATFDSGEAGPTLLVRCELDAIEVQEVNTFAHRSQTDGVAHKCGHDGHMTIVCGLAERLAQQRPQRGKVHLLFQPAEETGEGAQAVLDDPKFGDIQPDMGVALHNMPGYPAGTIVVREGAITAAVSSLIVRFQGRTSHASEPEHGLNPALAVAELVQWVHSLNRPDPADPDFALVTVVCVRVGTKAYGVSAGDGEAHFTLRSWSDAALAQLRGQILEHGQRLAQRDGLKLSSQNLQTFYSNHNHPAVLALVRKAAAHTGLELHERSTPLKGGEDFGVFTARFPCCMFLLGSGEDLPALHNPDYDFPDSLIPAGVQMFEDIVRQVLG